MPTLPVTPARLHFQKLLNPFSGIDQFSDRFSIITPDDFDSGVLSDLYNEIAFSGATTVTYGSGLTVFEVGAVGQHAVQSKAGQPIAPYCWSEQTVTAWGSGAAATVGFIKDANNYFRWDVHGPGTPNANQVGLAGKIGGTGIGSGYSPSNPLNLTVNLPFKIRCVLCYPEWWGWIEDSNGNRAAMRGTIGVSPDMRLLTNFSSGWKPFFGALRFNNTTATLTATQFRSGYTGAIGVRDFKPLTYANGVPYVDSMRPSKRFYSTTCATGADFRTNHLSVMSVDVDTGAAQVESILFFNIANTDRTNPAATKDMCTSLYGGQIVRDVMDTTWQVVVNGWGLGNVATGIKLWYAETSTDLTTGDNVLALDAHQLTLYTSVGIVHTTSLYDNSFYWDGTKWRLVCAETATATNWSSYNAALFEGVDFDNLIRVARDTTHSAEGTVWSRIGDTWYVTSGGAGGPHIWDSSLTYQSSYISNLTLTGLNTTFSSFGSHFGVIPINRDGDTSYFALLFSNDQLLSANASKGKLVVMDSDEIATGLEFGGM